MRNTKVKLGDEVLFKVGHRRGRPTSGWVIKKSKDELEILRPYQRTVVHIAPEDVVSLAHQATYTRPAKRVSAKKIQPAT